MPTASKFAVLLGLVLVVVVAVTSATARRLSVGADMPTPTGATRRLSYGANSG